MSLILKTNIFDWNSEYGFNEIFEQKGGFDYIIGNPPYVEVKNYNVDLPFMHLYIKDKFPSSKNGKVDLAIPFIEKSIELLNKTGRLGFIIQKRFFKTNYGKKIREVISTSQLLSSIIDFETTSIFKNRITYVSLLLLDKSKPDKFSYKNFKENIEVLPSALRQSNTPDVNPENYIFLPSATISENPWSFDDSKLIALKTNLLEKIGTLGNYAKVRVGIQALWNEAYHIKPLEVQNGIITGKSHLENNFKIELGACCALLPNENFYPYRDDNPETYCIFPYAIKNGKSFEIPFNEFCDLFPLAGKYLARNKVRIKHNVETLLEDKWHLYTRANNIARNFPKVYIPMTALDTYAAVTFSDKHYCDNANVNYVELPIINEVNLYAFTSIINSTVYSVLARSIANPQSNGYFKFNKQFLEPVPFPGEIFSKREDLKIQLFHISKKIEELQ